MSNKGVYTTDFRRSSARDEEVTEIHLEKVRAALSSIPGVVVHPWAPPTLFEHKAPLTFSPTCDRAEVTRVALTQFTGVDISEKEGEWAVYVAKRRALDFSNRAWLFSVIFLSLLAVLLKIFQKNVEEFFEF